MRQVQHPHDEDDEFDDDDDNEDINDDNTDDDNDEDDAVFEDDNDDDNVDDNDDLELSPMEASWEGGEASLEGTTGDQSGELVEMVGTL